MPEALRDSAAPSVRDVSPECGVTLIVAVSDAVATGGRAGWLGGAMSFAGSSAHSESERQLAIAGEHERAAAEARDTAARYRVAAVTEANVARRLVALSAMGYHLLPDRGWPGSRRAQVDLVVVGPAGLFIVDTKAWKDVTVAAGHIFRGQEDVTEDLDNLADLAYSTEAAMAEVGLAPGEVHAVAVLAGMRKITTKVGTVDVVGEEDILRHIASGGMRLTSAQVDLVLGAALRHFPVLGSPAPIEISIPEPVMPEATETPELATDEEVQSAILEGMLATPIEDWMSFLHPDQAKLVRRSFSGPSRIRGAAGTGKTVVGLHRAAYLARSSPGRVLVTTYVRSLPAVLATLLQRMAPDVSDRVEFVNVHAFARRLLQARGINFKIDPKRADAAFEEAWRESSASGILPALDPNKRYWRDEIDHVIKGRGITTFEAYANLARTGRKRTLKVEQRRAMWNLFVGYQSHLRAARVNDFSDLITMAEASLRTTPLEGYTSVIVDEAQDLSCSAIKMLHHLVGNRSDGLTLIGDGRQTIYPGGFTLAEVGISLSGRGVVMTTNYRNTAEILTSAARMVDGLELADLEGLSDAAPDVLRSGSQPVIREYSTHADHDRALVDHLREVTAILGTDLGDVAVLGLDGWALKPTMVALAAAGVPCLELDQYTGEHVRAVKVGTIKRAKGLEFKQVLLVNVNPSLLGAELPKDDGELERRELMRRELYVGMTRARDGLWVGSVRR